MQLLLHRTDMFKHRQDFLQYAVPPVMLHHLGKIPDPDTRRLLNAALRGRLLPRYELHQSGLAGPVLTHKANLVLLADMEIDAIQQHIAAIGHGYVTDGYHGTKGWRIQTDHTEEWPGQT